MAFRTARECIVWCAGLLWAEGAFACSACAPLVRARIYQADFTLNLALVLLPVAVFGLLAWWVNGFGVRSHGDERAASAGDLKRQSGGRGRGRTKEETP